MIGIIDYGMGNLFSVSKALERLNAPYFISEKKEDLLRADALILPGVGAFPDAMERLNESGLAEMIREYIRSGKPFLGICLGMQLLFEESEEGGLTTGLGILPGRVVRFTGHTKDGQTYKVPHMGWNKLNLLQSSPIIKEAAEDYVYFVHSYHVDTKNKDVVIAEAEYDVKVPAVVGRENVFATQFHPEKSSRLGMELLGNFTRLVEGKEMV